MQSGNEWAFLSSFCFHAICCCCFVGGFLIHVCVGQSDIMEAFSSQDWSFQTIAGSIRNAKHSRHTSRDDWLPTFWTTGDYLDYFFTRTVTLVWVSGIMTFAELPWSFAMNKLKESLVERQEYNMVNCNHSKIMNVIPPHPPKILGIKKAGILCSGFETLEVMFQAFLCNQKGWKYTFLLSNSWHLYLITWLQKLKLKGNT